MRGRDDESPASKADSELDALMDKYDSNEGKPAAPKRAAKKAEGNSSGASKSDIQDAELRILQGNNLADSSNKANEDDLFNEILDKFVTKSKNKNDDEIITKDNAKEALTELYEKKLNDVDGYKAQEEVKNTFSALWDEADIMKKGYIDRSEAYNLVQDAYHKSD
jgi:hypothetical protein